MSYVYRRKRYNFSPRDVIGARYQQCSIQQINVLIPVGRFKPEQISIVLSRVILPDYIYLIEVTPINHYVLLCIMY